MVHVISTLRPASAPAHTAPGSRRIASGSTAAGGSTTSAAADFRALFSSKTTGVTVPDPPVPAPAPTAESVFGPNPWIANPTGQGPNGVSFGYNPYYFATPQTAEAVARMVGGTVVQTNQFTPNGGPFAQQQPNNMVRLPDGRLINPGLVASFYDHGYPQSYVDMMVACEVKNA